MSINDILTPLKKIASIQISSVDKKSIDGEKTIRLCNFTNVYNNWAITNSLKESLMIASANQKEIDLFSIKKGDVAITKDSETRDDIGVSTYISDDFSDVVLGYHCALIRPNQKVLYGKFLNAFLNTKSANIYFYNNASGSGQRFTLATQSIEDIKIPLFPMSIQIKIGDFMSLIDKIVENNNAIISKCNEFLRLVYEHWFYQFDFRDSTGKPYIKNGGSMVFDDKLKRYIPEGWKSQSLFSNDISQILEPGVNQFTQKTYLATADVDECSIKDGSSITFEGRESRANMQPVMNSVWFAKMKNTIKHISVSSSDLWLENEYIFSTGFCGIKTNENSFSYIHCFVNSQYFEFVKNRLAHGATQEAVNNGDLDSIYLVIPPTSILEEFSKITLPVIKSMNKKREMNRRLIALRSFALPLLVNGQANI